MAGDLSAWEAIPEGCLALLILLDQYPRNAFRGTKEMYHSDQQALSVAHHAEKQEFIRQAPRSVHAVTLRPFRNA